MSNKVKAKGQSPHSKGMWIKILVPALIVVVVAGIFIFKNQPQETDDKGAASQSTAQNSAAEQKPEQSAVQGTDSADNTDIDFNSSEFGLDATNDLDLDKILSYGLPVIIDFGADSCIPCKEMAPVLKELNEELRGKAIVKFVDVWKNADAAQAVPLKVIPTQFFFDKDGNPYVPSDAQTISFTMYGNQKTNEHLFTAHEGGLTKDQILAVLKELGVE
jgi:thioredoxin 1